MKVTAIIPSAGTGSRTGFNIPKQYIKFNGKELIAYTLSVFQNTELIDEIIVSASPSYFNTIESIKKNLNLTKVIKPVEGGKTRQESVKNAFLAADLSDEDIIAVHDAARPLLPQNVLINSVLTAKEKDACVTAIKARDTLIKGNETALDYVNREEVYYAQTPQCFKAGIFRKSIEAAETTGFIGTDESMLVKNAGYDVFIVEGSSLNFKVTNKDDIEMFELLAKNI